MTQNSWERFIEGSSEEGAELFRKEYEQTQEKGALYNLGLALMDMERFDEARDVYCRILEMEEREDSVGEGTLIYLGMTEWMKKNPTEAIGTWKKSFHTPYVEAGAGLAGHSMVWYGAIRTGDEKLKQREEKAIKRLWKVPDPDKLTYWPGPFAIAGYILGQVSAETFLNRWKESHPIIEARRLCRANFWAGVRESNVIESRRHFHHSFSRSKVGILEFEYFLAKWEWKRLSPSSV